MLGRIILSACATLICISPIDARCLKGNCYNGQGVYIFASGAKYVGHFNKGQINGKGTLYFSNGDEYTGSWFDNKRHGSGSMRFQNGDAYRGAFRHNRFHGQGKMTFADGSSYEGLWKGSKPHGQGVMNFKSGAQYEGVFQSGKRHGHGTMYYTDGSIYKGSWTNDLKDGAGKLIKKNGTTVSGHWSNGSLEKFESPASAPPKVSATVDGGDHLKNCNDIHCHNELGYYRYKDGSRYEGEFVNGMPLGKGKCFYKNGDIYTGGWEDHSPHGKGTIRYVSGKRISAFWHYGRPSKIIETPDFTPATPTITVDNNSAVKIWALVVGVARYHHMPTLKFTDDDAYQIYAFLKSPEGGALPDQQIKILIDETATRENIIATAKQLFWKADENDVVIMYFSGHGQQGSFLPFDYDGYANKMKHAELLNIFDNSKAKHKLCLADACHSGTLATPKDGYSSGMKTFYTAFESSAGGTALFMSSRGEEVSLEDHGLRQGVFSHFLIRGLKGESDVNKDKIVSVSELYRFVTTSVKDYTSGAQNPVITGNFDMKMPIAFVR